MKIKQCVIGLVIAGLFLFSGVSKVSAEDVTITSPEVSATTVVKTTEGTVTVVPEENPFRIMADEILSFAVANNIGVAGYMSSESDDMETCLAVQLGQSKHKWINYGLDFGVSETDENDDNLNSIGVYAGINGAKIIEKLLKKSINNRVNVTIGWTEMYYFSDTDNISEGWDGGLFAAVAIPL